MYYLSGRQKGRKYGVIDTKDGVEEFFTMSDMLTAESRGFKIYGLFRKYGYLYCFGMTPLSMELLTKTPPVAVAVRLSRGLGFMQTVYMGYRVNMNRLEFVFFNDGGESGLVILTSLDFQAGGVALDFVNLDHRRAEVLMRRLKDSGGFRL